MKNPDESSRAAILKCLLFVGMSFACGIPVFGADPVGIIMRAMDGALVLRDGKPVPVRAGDPLFPGDEWADARIEKPDVKWWPYSGFFPSANGEKLIIETRPPENVQGKALLTRMKEFFGFVESEYENVNAVARSFGEAVPKIPRLFPLPGPVATLFDDFTLRFDWDQRLGSRTTLLLRDSEGKTVFQRTLEGPVTLGASDFGQASGAFTWELSDLPGNRCFQSGRIHIVSGLPIGFEDLFGFAREIRLTREEREPCASDSTRLIEAAGLCQFASDLDHSVDLYWLSFEFLRRIDLSQLAGDDRTRYSALLHRIKSHLQCGSGNTPGN